MEKENKKVTRRKFLEDSSKKALVGSAAAFLGLGLVKPKTVEAAGCWPGCFLGCSDQCTSACSGICNITCETACTNDCSGECKTSCNYACTGSRPEVANLAQAECGTPVSERDATYRHVTA